MDDVISVLYSLAKFDRGPEVFRRLAAIYRIQGKPEAARQAYETAMSRSSAHENTGPHSATKTQFDFVEFMIEQKDHEGARALLRSMEPASEAERERLQRMSAFAH
jgi:Tfp pilus assembly protein PilF